ncbi:MAG TPA: hypothetical protein VEJ67_11165 [Candidatus Cybelea sp.]|nr:hypothetical protein [Candidatus Cybelea sp.]
MALSVSQRVAKSASAWPWVPTRQRFSAGSWGTDLVLAALGVGIGFAGALGPTRLLRSLLFEVDPGDPATFLGVALALIVATVIASYIPARRAASVDPNVPLRCE